MRSFPQKVMVLAAGYGKRMLPITNRIPKPLVEIKGEPIIHHIIKKILKLGIQDIIINVHHLSEEIINSLKIFGPRIKIIKEKKLLETGGGVLNAIKKKKLGTNLEPFFVINGDIFWIEKKKSSLKNLYKNWDEEKMDVLLILKDKSSFFGYKGGGDFDFLQKKKKFGEINNINFEKKYAFSGVQLLHPKIFDGYNKKKFSLKEIYFKAMHNGRLFGVTDENKWFHIGAAEDLTKLNKKIK